MLRDGDQAKPGHSLSTDPLCILSSNPAPNLTGPALQEAVLGDTKGVATVPRPSVCISVAWVGLLYPGRVGSSMPGFPWLWCLAPAKQSGDSWSHSTLGHPSPCLGKHPLHWQLGTHAPHSTFRERMLSKPHSMMFGQAEVNSILLPWKFSWSYTVIWNGERAAELENCPAVAPGNSAPLGDRRRAAPSGGEPAEAAAGTLWAGTQPRTPPHPCTAGPATPCPGAGGAAGWAPLRSRAHPCGDQFPGQRCRPERGAEPFWDGRVAGLWLAVLPASAPNALGQRGLTGERARGTSLGGCG